MTDKKRIAIRCWNCSHIFTWLVAGQPELLVPCPLCGSGTRVKLAPFRRTIHVITAGDGAAGTAAAEADFSFANLDLPDVLESEPAPPEKEEDG